MNRFYRKPKPETMKKNRETYAKLYPNEIKWLSDNFDKIQKHNKFLLDMCMILKTGGRELNKRLNYNLYYLKSMWCWLWLKRRMIRLWIL
jgi:hypothetical protein